MLRNLGVVLLAASALHLWGVVLQVGGAIADPFSEVAPLERISVLSLLVLTGGGVQALVGWYLWRRGEGVVAEAVPYGALRLVRLIGTGFLVGTTVVEVAAAAGVVLQQWVIVNAMSFVSLPTLTFGFFLFWLGARLPPPAPKETKRPASAARRAGRRQR